MKQLGASSLAPQHHWDSRISGPALLLLAWKRLGEMKQLGASSLATQHNWDSCITATTLMPPIRWRWTGRRWKLLSVDGAPKSHVVFCRKLDPRGRTIYRWIISAGPRVPLDQITGSICGIKSHCGCPLNSHLIPQTEDKHWRPVIAFITHVGNTKASHLLHITEYWWLVYNRILTGNDQTISTKCNTWFIESQ